MLDFLRQYKKFIIIIALILICCAFPRFAYILFVIFIILLAIFGATAIILIDYIKKHGTSKAKEKLVSISNWLKEEKEKLDNRGK